MIDRSTPASVLVIGYGNPGRLDDGLGPALVAALEAQAPPPGVTLDSNYQLNVEDAETIAAHDAVLFVDADVAGPEPFGFEALAPRVELGFSSHSVAPAAVLGLARQLFAAGTHGFVLGIRGHEFDEFGERLSARAQKNLDQAVRFVKDILREDSAFRRDPASYRPGPAEPSGDGEAT